jgi:predicted nucleotidyltransferase
MPLPSFNEFGDLPVAVYKVTFDEVIARFGSGSAQREQVTKRLGRVCELASRSGALDRIIIFGSYITDKAEPNDVDVVLVLHDNFRIDQCPAESAVLFDHGRAADELGASVFWIRPSMLIGETLDQFIAGWQIKRDLQRRGILEVRP